MPNSWKTYKLSEVGEIIGGGTPSTTKQEYYNGNISWITPRDLSNHNSMFISKGERSITELGLKNSSAKLMPKGSVLLTSRAPIGYLAISENEVCTNQGFKSIAVNDKIADNKFIYYLLKTNIDLLLQNATGSTFQEVSGNIIKNLEFKFPPLQEQQSIASILSAIDDKIENNLAINKTLEEMAMALYNHWFVDFGPFQDGEFVESDLGKIPKGWEVKRLDEICNITIGRTPPRKEPKWFSQYEGVKWISIKDIGNSGIYISETSEYLSEEAITKFNVPIINPNTVILSFKLTVGRVAISYERMLSNEAIAHLNRKDIEIPVEFLYSYLKLFDYNSLGSTSSIATAVNTQTIKAMKIIIPNKKLLNTYFENVNTIFEQIKINQNENQTLTQLRDTLLPKLISGEVRLKEFRE